MSKPDFVRNVANEKFVFGIGVTTGDTSQKA